MRNRQAYDSVLDLIHETPVVRLSRISSMAGSAIFAKLEFFNPGGSIKDRVALAMVEDAEAAGRLTEGMSVIEATSGSMGVALAMVCCVKGYHAIAVMRHGVSRDKIDIIKAFGGDVEFTDARDGIQGSIQEAKKLAEANEDAVFLDQFENDSNWLVNRDRTGRELFQQLGELDAVCIGAGSGGTLRGIASFYKEHSRRPPLVVLVEPAGSVYAPGGTRGAETTMTGIGNSFKSSIASDANFDVLVDRYIQVTDAEAYDMVRNAALLDGVLLGSSAGAVVHAATQVAKEFPNGRIAAVATDSLVQHLSEFREHNCM